MLILALALPTNFTSATAQSDKVEKTDKKPKQFGYRPESASLHAPGKIAPLTAPRSGKPLDIALGFIKQSRQKMGLSETDVLDLKVTDQYTDSHNGVTHIYLRQQIDGIEVVSADMSTNVARDGKVINLNSSLIKELRAAVRGGNAALSPSQAVEFVTRHLGLTLTETLDTLETKAGAERETTLSRGGVASEPIRVKLVFQPVAENEVRLAWSVELSEISGRHWWNISVDAVTGEILAGYDYIDHDNWGSNVVPDVARNRSFAARIAATAPRASLAAASTATVTDGSSYNVYALPLESPNDGSSTLQWNPADALASPFGWHDTNGATGAEYTRTRGNNVHAYTDLDANNAVDTGSDPDGGANLQFNYQFDPTKAPELNRPPAVVNLFYWNNIVHDVFYKYGFNEAAGNFQVNNYGKGGAGNDYVQAEAQDGSGTNNANFGTPPDNGSTIGSSRPRMQMFVWTNPYPNAVVVNNTAIAGNYIATSAESGPAITATGVTGDVVLGLDPSDAAGASTTDGCSPLTNASSVAGKIALLDRGSCSFVIKIKNAQNAGAIAVIMGNNVAGDPISMGGADNTINISSAMVSLDNANLYKSNLPFNASLKINPNPAPNRDSDFDAGIIGHEYGHGISNRLTGGRLNTSCLGNQEQMGEGWSDFVGLVLTTAPLDTAATERGIGTYVSFQSATGKGIRPTPYTTNTSVNPSTYNTIKTAAVPHGVGYVWATMLWEMYWNLVEVHGYNPNVYEPWNTGGNNLAIQLVTDGMKLQPCSPGFIDGRDAILQADMNLTGGANQCLIWKAFAKRGLGVSATQGSNTSVTDGTEAFNIPASCETVTTVTSLSVNSATGTQGGTVNLSATLTNGTNGIGGKTVSFTLNGTNAGSAVTDANGVASLSNASLGSIAAGTYPNGVGASFAAGGGFGGSSATNSLTVVAAPLPAAPSGLVVTVPTQNGRLNLNWTDNSNNESGFKIERCTGANCTNFALIGTVEANVTAVSNSNLARRTTYGYRVYSYNASGNSAYSNVSYGTTR
ncbi:MAG TPA: T9SS-dependent M36 family metallopeptidase [Pyrinomonadaceae bacterium]|nr:T9SS-dependent M36 family metallopeptidase [Pyrinomonadaceae bacterium]